jgi:hypothetical protein
LRPRTIKDQSPPARTASSCSFQCLIGEIIGYEGFVNLVEIASIVHHCAPPEIEVLLINKLNPIGYRERASGAVLYVTAAVVARLRLDRTAFATALVAECLAPLSAKALGLTFPLTLLGRADEIIE